jgi:Kelch motif protein
MVLLIVAVAIVAGIVAHLHGGAGTPAARLLPSATRRGLAAAESGLLPWRMTQPISREAVTAGPGGQLIVLGGLTSGSTSAAGIYAVRTATGATRQIGTLSAGVHDAAAAVSGGRTLILGGGSPATVDTVQSFPVSGLGAATSTGSLPAPRSDAQAVTIGSTAYVVGGYDGNKPDASVLATSDGRSFRTIAALPVPVRYPAVAAQGGQILVFGGQAITGQHAGAPVSAIQAVNPARHTATVIGTLPEPLTGATAVTVNGEVFVAGGESTTARRLVPGEGTTRFSGVPTARSGTEGSSSATVSAIWAYDPGSRRLLPAGQLRVPVSHAGAAVSGSTAWIVGGESNGTQVSTVQMLRPDRAFGSAGASGAGSARVLPPRRRPL